MWSYYDQEYLTSSEDDASFFKDDSYSWYKERQRNESESVPSSVYYPTEIKQEILTGLNEFRDSKLFCDVILKTDDETIWAHKVVLASCSLYFRSMFSGNFKESKEDVVNLHDMNGKHVKLLIDYIYTGRLEVNKDNALAVLQAAAFLQIKSAEDICLETVVDTVCSYNCLEILSFARCISLQALVRHCINYAVGCFIYLYRTDAFKQLEFSELLDILKHPDIKDINQDIVTCAVHIWILHSKEDRLKHLLEILNCINSERVCDNLAEDSILFKDNPIYSSWKKYPKREWWLCLFHTLRRAHPQRRLLYGQSVLPIERMPTPLNQASYTSYGHMIYVLGGWSTYSRTPGNFTQTAYYYDPYSDRWSNFCPLQEARSCHKSCFINSYLYSIGGKRNLTTLSSVECLDILSGKNLNIADLNNKRSSFGIATHENCIYVIGGYNETEYIKSVERYDHRVGKWDILSTSPYTVGECSSVLFQDNIYSTFNKGRSMERYDFKMDKWIYIQTRENKYACELFTMNDGLYGVFRTKLCDYDVVRGTWYPFYPFGRTNYMTCVPLYVPCGYFGDWEE